MNGITSLDWAAVAAVVVMVAGLALALRGLHRCRVALPSVRAGSMQPLTWMHGFRLTLFGLALAGAGAAWLWHLGWLLALSLAIGGEEVLESSIAISALRAQPGLTAASRRRASE